MTLRARLTLWYAAVLAGALVFFGAVVYLLLSYSLTLQIEDSLKQTADDILLASRRNVRGVVLPPLDLAGDTYIQVWAIGEGGEPSLLTSNFSTQNGPLSPDTLEANVRTFASVNREGIRLRVLTVPVIALPGGDVIGHIELAKSLEPVDRARELLVFIMVPGGFLAVAIASVFGWTTARRAMRPLDDMTETALQISQADDLSRRIPLKGPPEGEVGRLVLAFNETLERLENLFQAQRRFLADVSHELRTPLTTIRGNIDLMEKLGEADPEALIAITSEVDRMTRLVRDLLLLAQAESGNLPLGKDVVELDTLLLEVYHESKILAQGRLQIKLGEEDQARVLGDRDRIKQVLLNLAGNAIQYTPQGGRVTLGLNTIQEWARLVVADTGPGIPQEELPHIFERFYRIDRSRNRGARGGAGLGLSIAYWITRSHGGLIEVASEQGRGTTFSVWLPLYSGGREIADTAPQRRRVERGRPQGGDRSAARPAEQQAAGHAPRPELNPTEHEG